MKRFLSLFLLSAICVSAAAQQRQVYLFPDFPSGSIYVNGVHRPQQVKMNIDALGQRIYYFQGDVLMELTQLYRLDSIKVSGHTFVRKQGLLCERLALQKDTVFVNWKFKKVHMGSAGALGITTQSNVQTLWNNPDMEVTSGEGHYSGTGALSPEILRRRQRVPGPSAQRPVQGLPGRVDRSQGPCEGAPLQDGKRTAGPSDYYLSAGAGPPLKGRTVYLCRNKGVRRLFAGLVPTG